MVAQTALPCTASSTAKVTKVADSEVKLRKTRENSESGCLKKIGIVRNSTVNLWPPKMKSVHDSSQQFGNG